MKKLSRRELLAMSASLTTGLMATGLSATAGPSRKATTENHLKLMVVGAHPDDPETGCGGMMARYAKNGHEVVAVYLTRGEAGIPGKSHAKAAKIRTAEAEKACAIIGARPVFATQVDGATELNANRYDEMRAIIEKENPDIVLAHWPLDTHRDHRIASLLVYDAWLWLNRRFALYYFEVMTGVQTQNFNPTDFVDITEVIDIKHRACYQHVSQHIEEEYDTGLLHGKMEIFRGMEGGYQYAEAFARQMQSRNMALG